MSQYLKLARIKRMLGPRTLTSVGALAGVLVIAGCNSDSNVAPAGPQGTVQFVNAAPRYNSVDLIVDSLDVAPGETYGYGSTVPIAAQATARQLRVAITNDTTILASTSVLISDQSVYTVILTQHPVGAGLMVLPNTVTAPTGNQASVRLINASPSAGAVDVYVTTSTDTALVNPIATALPLEGVSSYVNVPPGTERVRVTTTGTKTVLLDINDSLLGLASGQVRTVLMIDSQGGGLPATWLEIPDLN